MSLCVLVVLSLITLLFSYRLKSLIYEVSEIDFYDQEGILHSSVYTFFEKVCIIELKADAETGNSKFEIR